MLHVTTKLKRVKYVRKTVSIILMPITLPLILLQVIGISAEKINHLIRKGYFQIENRIAVKFNLDELALNRHKKGDG